MMLCRYSYILNTTQGNIGARRLTSVMHTVMESVLFAGPKLAGTTQTIDREYVSSRMKQADPMSEENLSKYIL